MAWTWPTATFFVVIALLLIGMGVWEYAAPGGNPRIRILRFETTRGDRLFPFAARQRLYPSCLAWSRWIKPLVTLALSVVYAVGVFRYV
ncbi:DUF2160 domain-containing protein [Rhizobium beringeri]